MFNAAIEPLPKLRGVFPLLNRKCEQKRKKQKGDAMKKNKTKITTAFVIALLLSSFSYSQAQELDPYQFFPANIGDRWEYTMSGGDQIYTVVRDSIDPKDSSRFVFFYDPPHIMEQIIE